MDTLFLAFLTQHDDAAWLRAIDRLERACHAVDRAALRIWFQLYPLALQRAMAAAEALDESQAQARAAEGVGLADALESRDGHGGREAANAGGRAGADADGVGRLDDAAGGAERTVPLRAGARQGPVLTEAMRLARRLRLDGRWRLADQVDSSHWFFYGHRYWPAVKAAVRAYATRGVAPGSLDLGAQIQEIARGLAADTACDVAELVGITAVGVRTLQQVGMEAFTAPPAAEVRAAPAATADTVLAARARDDWQGLLGRFRGDRRRWTVTFGEGDGDRFLLTHSQHLTTAAAADTRDYRARDARCTEGPIPVQCRSCSCGTCWVGVLGGAEKLSPVDERERRKLAQCGYSVSTEAHPQIRLACMAQAFGAVSIVIPPWNGQIGTVTE